MNIVELKINKINFSKLSNKMALNLIIILSFKITLSIMFNQVLKF